MAKSKIQWTERTWNPVTGCTKYTAGCAYCYAEVMARRLKGMGQEKYKDGFRVSLHPEALSEPSKVKEPSVFFVCSMGDLFHQDVPYDFIDKVMQVMLDTPWHTYQVLTKRAERMSDYASRTLFPDNVWLGVSVERQDYKNRIDMLRGIGGDNVKFLSCEPLLGDLGELDLKDIDWVIVGGESGVKARKMRKDWIINIKRQCEIQNTAFFFKQWGAWGEDGVRRSKKANGRMLDGLEYNGYPNRFDMKRKC